MSAFKRCLRVTDAAPAYWKVEAEDAVWDFPDNPLLIGEGVVVICFTENAEFEFSTQESFDGKFTTEENCPAHMLHHFDGLPASYEEWRRQWDARFTDENKATQ